MTARRPAPVRSRGLRVMGAVALLAAVPAQAAAHPATTGDDATARACTADAPPYYAFELVTTARLPGTAQTRGEAMVSFAPSPYGVSLAEDGSYLVDVAVTLERLPEPARGAYVAWATTTQVDRVRRLGVVENGRADGRVAWNKFLVVVTLEPSDDPDATTWSGPIVLRGMSRSGMMHTMAGHGPFQQENCAAYGYDD